MTKEDLLKELSLALSKTRVLELAGLVSKESGGVKDLIDLSFYSEQSLAFRASWVLEQVFFFYEDDFKPYLMYFLERYPGQENLSCQRHYTKIQERITAQRQKYPELIEYDWNPVIESTFKWLTEPPCPVAVQVYCLDILFNLKDFDAWIAEELEAQTVFLLKEGSAAMQARGKAVLKRLQKSKRGGKTRNQY